MNARVHVNGLVGTKARARANIGLANHSSPPIIVTTQETMRRAFNQFEINRAVQPHVSLEGSNFSWIFLYGELC